jgi:hypothetical protein
MLDPEKCAEFDQMSAAICEVYPALWRGLYKECCVLGFSEAQSMRLVVAYIEATCKTGEG